jgi:hypothetical protein
MLAGLYVGAGASSLVALEAAAAKGGAYNIVSISFLGSGSVRNNGMTTIASRRST